MGRNGVIGGTLKDREMFGFTGDMGDRLNCGGTGPDDADPLSGKIDLLVRPQRCVIGRPGKTV
jgi:hypothetical protein